MIDLNGRLEAHGFRFPERARTRSIEQTLQAAERIGYPVVLKADVEGLLHKTEVGAVRLHLRNANELRAAFDAIHAEKTAALIGARVEETVVENECTEGVELLLGIERNPQLGLTVTFGLGGVLAELIADVQVRTIPLSEADAASMVRSLGGVRLLRGFRGLPPVSETMLVERILAVAALADELGDAIESIDLNPILARGAEHVVLDAKAVWASCERGLHEVPAGIRKAHLERFFTARSVAVVGASATPGKVGN
ncbi:acetate--CoA ligase family protein, partial [Candidatus Bipolaricaulota bacterium]|nr:acetate--CoA ligase family protein [Candidatus Bipolaricaulota bacterium]